MKHFNATPLLTDEQTAERIMKERAAKFLDDVRRAPIHRGFKIVDPGAYKALRAHDSEKPAPTFFVTEEQMRALYAAEWRDYDPNLLAPPFDGFYVRTEKAIPDFRHLSVSGDDDPSERTWWGLYFGRLDENTWSVTDFFISEYGNVATGAIAKVQDDICFIEEEDVQGAIIPVSICDPIVLPNGENADYADCQQAARALVSFLLMLNNRDVEVLTRAPVNRAERKRQEREGAEYRITIPRTIKRLVGEVNEHKNLGVRVAHQVRGHLRHFASGKTTWVRPHQRGGNPERVRDYVASKLGLP